MTFDRCNWLPTLYRMHFWDTDNETVCITWNDLQRLLKVVGNVIFHYIAWSFFIRDRQSRRCLFSDKIAELILRLETVAKFLVGFLIMPPPVGKGAISVAFVRPSLASVRPSVAYIANNSRTQRPSVPKFGKISHLRRDSHTSFKVKRSKVRVRGGRGHTVSAEPGGHTACCYVIHRRSSAGENLSLG